MPIKAQQARTPAKSQSVANNLKSTTAKETTEKKTPEKKTTEKKTTAKKTTAKNTPEKKTPEKKTTAKITTEKETTEKETTEKQTTEQEALEQGSLSVSICGTTYSGEDGAEVAISITPFAGATLSGTVIIEKDFENDLVTAKYEEVDLTLTAAIPSLDADVSVKIEDFYADSDGRITGSFDDDVDFTVLGGKTLSLTKPTIDKEDASSDFEISSAGSVKGPNDPAASNVLEATICGGGINWVAESDAPKISFEFGEYFAISEGKMADYEGSGSDYAHLVTGGLVINAGEVVKSSDGASVTAKYNNRVDDGEISIDGDLTLSVMGQDFTLSGLTYDAPTKKLSGDSAVLALTIAGHEESIKITNPSITKGTGGMSFDFESAESSSTTEHTMFNGVVTLGPHTVTLEKKPEGNEVEAMGTLKVSPIPELEGEIEGGFTYNKIDGLNPVFSSGTIKLNKEFEPFSGVKIKDLFLGVEKDDEENTNFVGGGTLDLSIAKPKVSGTGENMKLVVNSKTKAVSFEVENITISTGLGDIGVSGLAYADGVLEAEEGKFEFDSSKAFDDAYFGGAASTLMGALKGLGVKLDITGSDITLSKAKGFNIGHIESQVNEIKISLLGLEAIYNIKEKKASLEKSLNLLTMLTGSDKIGIEIDFPIFPGVFATFGAGIKNGGEVALKIELLKEPEGGFWDLTLEADLSGSSVMAYIEGGVKVGSGWLASVYAKLGAEGGVEFEDTSKLEAKSRIETASSDGKRMIPKPTNLDINMELNLPLVLRLYLTLGFQALKFFKFEYTKTLAEKEITRFNPKNHFSWGANGEPKGSLGAKDILNKDKTEVPVQKHKPNEDHIEDISKMRDLSNRIVKENQFNYVGQVLDTAKENEANLAEEENYMLGSLDLETGKQNNRLTKFFPIEKGDSEDYTKLANKVATYNELADVVGEMNVQTFKEKMIGRKEIFEATAQMVPTFATWYRNNSKRVKEQKERVPRFVSSIKKYRSTLND